MLDMNQVVGSHDIVFVTFDTLRYDVAEDLLARGGTPNLARQLGDGWERRHTSGSFTYPAHQAFFAGFLPTPASPGPHVRLFAMEFEGSETTGATTRVFDAANMVEGLAGSGYHTVCVGGVGFFNKKTRFGRVLPDIFAESHWEPKLGVTDPRSTEHQFDLVARIVDRTPPTQRLFLFINLSALHQPNRHYLDGCERDCLESHSAALRYVDSQMPLLYDVLERRPASFCIFCSDHGTAYGENGYRGHRVADPVVWTVPYRHFIYRKRAG